MSYTVICWPESQEVPERKGYLDFAWFIAGEEDIEVYGDSAYVVDSEWWVDSEPMTEEEKAEVDRMLEENPDCGQTTFDVAEDFGFIS